jgi:hypothetical protein
MADTSAENALLELIVGSLKTDEAKREIFRTLAQRNRYEVGFPINTYAIRLK